MYIYKITDNTNNKVYVGITKRDPEKRFKEHCQPHFKRCYITRVILSRGKENFKMEVLEEVNTFDLLQEREKFYIKQLNSMHPNGYNLHPGGCVPKSEKRSHNKRYPKEAIATRLGSKHTEETRLKISKAIEGKVFGNRKKVIDSFGNKFDHVKDAAAFHGISRNAVTEILCGRNKKTRKGVIFYYAEGK